MDESSERDRGSRPGRDDARRQGRRWAGSCEDHRAGAPAQAGPDGERRRTSVEEASEDSFPASDPPPLHVRDPGG